MEIAFNENDKNAWIILVGIIESKTWFDALSECDISSMIPAYLDKEIKESDESLNESIEYALRILNIIVNYDQGDVINEMINETSIVDALLFIMENSGNYNDDDAEILLDMTCDKEKANIMLNKYSDILYHIKTIGNNGTINNIIIALLFVQYIIIFVEPRCIYIKEVIEPKEFMELIFELSNSGNYKISKYANNILFMHSVIVI